MNSAGITTQIFGFAKALVGWMHGGLGHVNIGASIIFAGMSGAAVADAGGLGTIEIKAMRDAGYDDDFSVGITAASSTIGPIIPPSLPLVIYGVMASASIGELFAAGFIPVPITISRSGAEVSLPSEGLTFYLSQLTPHVHAYNGYLKLMIEGAGLADVWPNILTLLGFGAVFLLVGLWRFKYE